MLLPIFYALVVASITPLLSTGQEEATGKINGIVVRLQSNLPVAHARVDLTSENTPGSAGATARSVDTDAAGRFAFSALKPGKYRLSASHDGLFNGVSLRGASSAVAVTVPQSGEDQQATLTLAPFCAIAGTVTNQDNEPVNDLDVQALRLDDDQSDAEPRVAASSKTTDDGRFRLGKLLPGQYLIQTRERMLSLGMRTVPVTSQTSPPDYLYPPTSYPAGREISQAEPLTVGVGQESPGVDLQVVATPSYTITGQIENLNGAPATLAWVDETGRRRIAADVESGKHRFKITGLVPGSYNILAEPDDEGTRFLGQQQVAVVDHNLSQVSIELQAATNIPGIVRVEDGEAKQDVSSLGIGLEQFGVHVLPKTPVSGNGSFLLQGVVRTRFRPVITKIPPAYYLKALRYANRVIPSEGVLPVIGATLEVVLSAAAGQLEGSVTGTQGVDVSNAEVFLIPQDAGPPAKYLRTSSNESGRFAFKGIPPGTYRLIAVKDLEHGVPPDNMTVRAHEASGAVITLPAQGHLVVNTAVTPL